MKFVVKNLKLHKSCLSQIDVAISRNIKYSEPRRKRLLLEEMCDGLRSQFLRHFGNLAVPALPVYFGSLGEKIAYR